MLVYTVRGSLPLLLGLLLTINLGARFLGQVRPLSTSRNLAAILSAGLLIAFLVKLPMAFLHIWLPKAHVEAPVNGSIFLAAVLLKIGGYGILKLGGTLRPCRKFYFLLVACTF